jgi:acetylglutamate kinase
VIAPVGTDGKGSSYNINADFAAAAVAKALKAEKLIFLSDVEGVYSSDKKLISKIYKEQVPSMIENGVISGGMIPKVECCIRAISEGVQNAIIMDGRVPHSILMELLTDEGAGTMVVGGEEYRYEHSAD